MTSARVWTAAEVAALGVRTTVPIAGEILLGLGPSDSYRAAASGKFPVPVLVVGRRKVVPVAHIVRLLGLDEADPSRNQSATSSNAETCDSSPARDDNFKKDYWNGRRAATG
jgi:hypothetical protein